jgi:iron complex transport system permease protein
VGVRLSLRTLCLVFASAVLLVALSLWAMTLGDFPLSVGEVGEALVGGATGPAAFIVTTLRMPRVLLALGVGFAFAASGAIFQGLVRNPLVSPDIIGINAGASLAAVFFIVTRGPLTLLPVAAFAGALVAAAAVYGLSWRKGIAGERLVLVGIGVNALATAGTTFLIVRFPIEVVMSAELWLSGTLYGKGWEQVGYVAYALALLVPAALWLSPMLRTLQLGDDMARSLGVRPEAARGLFIVVGSALAAAAVAAAGPIGFVALIVPHIARMLSGPFGAGMLMLSGMLGGLVVLVSDVVAQHAFAPMALPAGVVTAAVGAPYFMFLLYRTHRRA